MSSRFLILLFLISSISGDAQNKLIKTLKEEDKIESSYHLYPSTLRMINLQKDPAFDELIRPVEKFSIFILKQDSFSINDLHAAYQDLLNDGYEEYIEVTGDTLALYIAGNKRLSKTCFLAHSDSEFYLADLEGMINVLKLGEAYESISKQDTSQIGLGTVLEYVRKENNEKRERAHRRKERNANRAEEKKKESFQVTIGGDGNSEEQDSLPKTDSLNAIEEKNKKENPE